MSGSKPMVENLPVEEVSEESLRDFEKRLEELLSGKAETVSGDEAIKRLSALINKR